MSTDVVPVGCSPATLRILRLSRTAPLCPDCEFLMVPIDRCRDACCYCGQIVVNPLRVLRWLVVTFGATDIIDNVGDDHADRT